MRSADAQAQGNTEQAKEIMKLWVIDTTGSEIASIVGGSVGSIAIGSQNLYGLAGINALQQAANDHAWALAA